MAYAQRDDRLADRHWYYPSEYTDDGRYPYYVSGEQPPHRLQPTAEYASGRYDEPQRYSGGSSYSSNRYDDRYYGPKTSGYLPALVPDTRYAYGPDYRGNGYDNRDAQYTMRTGGADPYYRGKNTRVHFVRFLGAIVSHSLFRPRRDRLRPLCTGARPRLWPRLSARLSA